MEDEVSDALRQIIGSLRHSKYNFKNSLELNERMQKIILWRYGLDEPYAGFEPTFQNIGDILGIGVVRVKQIEAKALRMLRHPSNRKLLLELV